MEGWKEGKKKRMWGGKKVGKKGKKQGGKG